MSALEIDVMLDLETLGVRPGCAILSIGAVMMDRAERRCCGEFHAVIDLQSCLDVGLKTEADAVKFWMAQPDAARAGVMSGGAPIQAVLGRFSAWLEGCDVTIWSNGANFDAVILREAYLHCGMATPWAWRRERCWRTLRVLFARDLPEKKAVAHDALADAKAQAEEWINVMEVVG